MEKVFAIFGKIVLILIVVGALVGGGVYLDRSYVTKLTSPIPKVTPIVTKIVVVSPTISSPSPTNPQQSTHFAVNAGGISPFVQYTLSGINGWTLAKDHKDTMDKVTLTQGDYQLTILQAAIGGGGCAFPGETSSQMSIELTNPIDIPLLSGTPLRRGTSASTNPNQSSFTVCQKASDGSYGSLTTFGVITYTTPLTFDQNILSQMDAMVGSLQKE